MVQQGDQIPHFSVGTVDGSRARYAEIWQRKNLVLVSLPLESRTAGVPEYAAALMRQVGDISALDGHLVVTFDPIPNLPCPGVVVADRWGEIYFVAGAPNVPALPPPDEILEWLHYVANECPECQGETR